MKISDPKFSRTFYMFTQDDQPVYCSFNGAYYLGAMNRYGTKIPQANSMADVNSDASRQRRIGEAEKKLGLTGLKWVEGEPTEYMDVYF